MLATLMAGVLLPAGPAYADHTVDSHGTYTDKPNFFFFGNASKTWESKLNAWFTHASTGVRWRVSQQAGSGDGSTDECWKSHGWLPEGEYGRDDGDPNSDMIRIYKTWGVEAVRGHVWDLRGKWCHNGSYKRTELFIHSNGIEGTGWNYNWKTAGCIKVSQHARSGIKYYYDLAYDRDNDWLWVAH